MGNIITLVICLVLVVVLGIFIIFMIKTLFSFIAMHFRATKTFITKPGAEEAYELLKRNAVNGNVSYEVMEQAITLMLSKGVSPDEVYNFIADCNMLIGMDAQKTRNFIYKTEEKIRNLSYIDAQLYTHLDPVEATQASMYIDQKKAELETDIDDAKERLKI